MENGFEMICLELIEEVIINGAKMDGEIYNGTFLDGKPLELEEFMNILVTNNIRRFLQIEMDNDDKMTSYKDMIKLACVAIGVKFSNAITMKVFRTCQKLMAENFIAPELQDVEVMPIYEDMNEVMEDFDKFSNINKLYVTLCKMTNVEVESSAIYAFENDVESIECVGDINFDGNLMQWKAILRRCTKRCHQIPL